VTVSQGSERDDAGSEGGGFAKVAKGNGILFDGGVGGSGSGQKQQTGGGGGDESGSDQSSGGGGGEDSGESTSSPSMTSDGTVTAPAFDLSDAFVGNVINWNRLGGAVTQPAPHRDEEGEPGEQDSGKKMSPCGQLDDKDFDPNPAYLRPNKQGWVTDPVPFLRGSSPSRGRDR
jgi:hypothetical protein